MPSTPPVALLTAEEQEARHLIDTIRVKHSTVAHEELAQIVTSLLHLTSSELYDRSTHCILELLQNADDNHYDDDVLPTLTFTSEPDARTLRVDCNELGFKPENVEAISTVRHSTKSGKNNSHEYTGEKGIGFKSVYRIADEVWISSRQYSFKFDKHQAFGMIAPVWAEFPATVKPNLTSFFLKLAEKCDQDDLIEDLKSFDPHLLLFLRRIRKVELQVLEAKDRKWSQSLCKTTKSDQKYTITTLSSADTQQQFVTFEHGVVDLPPEPRRPRISSSALTFAIPVEASKGGLLPGRQKVYALLPISDYGLRFSLNGDFILSANRLHIDESLPWNQKLRNGVANGFLAAVDYFNKGHLKYEWPSYIPDDAVQPFFSPTRDDIVTGLRSKGVLESYASLMAQPSSLVVIPNKYTDSSGQPFTLCPETAKKYVSSKYSTMSLGSMLALGVLEMNDQDFLEDLRIIIHTDEDSFRGKSRTWHQELCESLLPLTQKRELREDLMQLRMIPLCDGTWTSASREPVFFPNELDPTKFPSSIALSIIDPKVYEDYSRRTILQALDIVELNSTRLCTLIAETHASKSFHPEKLTQAELISHVAYLFNSSWQPPDHTKVDLWFATSDDGRCKGSQTYIRGDCKPDSAMARIFSKLREKFPSVHDNYFLDPADKEEVRLSGTSDSPIRPSSQSTSDSPIRTSSQSGEWPFHLFDRKFLWLEYEEDQNLRTTFRTGTTISRNLPRRGLPSARVLNENYLSSSWDDHVLLKTKRKDEESSTARRRYLIETLHLADMPRLVSRSNGTSTERFQLSDEFKFLFKECVITDVLQLLSDHWTTYAEWLELSAAQQQSEDAVASNEALLKEIRATKVRSSTGIVALCDMVFPKLDTYVDRLNIPKHSLEIKNHKSSVLRRRLAHFGIAVTNDLGYYLTCLRALSNDAFPEHDALTYLYEQVQLRYDHDDDDENTVYDAFYDAELIYIGSSNTRSSKSCWQTMDDAKEVREKVLDLYPECQNLFSWLLNTPLNDINALITEAKAIDASWTLDKISDLFIRISTELNNTSRTKARIAVKSMGNLAIFPVKGHLQRKTHDLVSTEDLTWFICDRAEFATSFEGIAPLLAFNAIEVEDMSSLLAAINVNSRRLSKLCSIVTSPLGDIQYSARDTDFLRTRSIHFISELIPKTHTDREKIRVQLENVVVMVATKIVESQVFKYKDGPEYVGHAIEGEVLLRVESGGKELQVFTPKKKLICQGSLYPLIAKMAEHCGIKDTASFHLVHAALSERRVNRVHHAFHKAGYAGHEPDSEGSNFNVSKRQRHVKSGDILRIPSIFLDSEGHSDDSDLTSGTRSARSRNKSRKSYLIRARKQRQRLERLDPRLPLLNFTQVGFEPPLDPIQGEYVAMQTLDPFRHLEFYGQRLVSELFKDQLRGFYDPEIHWTSILRTRAGLTMLDDITGTSPFTFADRQIATEMLSFLKYLGREVPRSWEWQPPTFHIETAVCGGHGNDPFIWSADQVNRTAKYQLPEDADHDTGNVVILIKINNVYSKPNYELVIDPWRRVMLDIRNRKFNAKLIHLRPQSMVNPYKKTFVNTPLNGLRTQDDPIFTTDEPTQSSFEYVPLAKGELRLFILLPGKRSDPVRGTLSTASSIEEVGSFRALSYEWGTKTQSKLIFTESGVLRVWDALHNTIIALREEKSAAVFWIDAICINQEDDQEKIHQIRMLPMIFQRASRTVAFIASDRQSDEAIETLLQIRAKLDDPGLWPQKLKTIPESWVRQPKPHSGDPIWQDIKHFFNRTWFRRAWIVQEAVAAPTVTVVCGKWIFDWEDLHSAMEVVRQEPHLPKDIAVSWVPFSTLTSLREWEARKCRFNLFTLLDTFHYLDSTLKRDHLFALLGLARDGDEKEFAPQYGSTDFASVACQYGQGFVRQGYGIHLLRQAGIAGRSELEQERFPSWLPDFTKKTSDRLLNLHDRGMICNASKGMKEKISCDPGLDNILRVNGCLVDEIDRVSEQANGPGPKQWIRYFAEIDDILKAVCGNTHPEYSHQLKVHVPIAGARSVGGVSIEESYAAFAQGLKKAKYKSAKKLQLQSARISLMESVDVTHKRDMTNRDKGKQYESLLKKNIQGWRFVVTKRKQCGIAPNGVKVGDSVGIIGGGEVPFILRKIPESEEHQLIAGCYIHGMMNGESLAFPDVEKTYFLLR